MARWEHYEVWVQQETDWQPIGAFMDLDVATAVARNRPSGVRVIRVVFEDSTRVEQEVLLEIGTVRKAS